MAYAQIYSLDPEPSPANPGDIITVDLIIRNSFTSQFSVMGDITYAYNGQTYAVQYTEPTSGTFGPGDFFTVEGQFSMPSSKVTLTVHTYYWNGTQWTLDQTQTLDLNLVGTASGWAKAGSSYSASVALSVTGQWAKTGASYSLSIPLSLTGQWAKAGTPLAMTIPLSLTGQWAKAGSSFTASIALSLTGGWAKLTGKTVSVTVKNPLTISTNSLANGSVGTAYNKALAATGGVSPYAWSIASGSLPEGLGLSPAGVISGTPMTETTGTNNPLFITVEVTDSMGSTATKTLTISITAAGAGSKTNWTPYVIGGAVAAVGVGAIAIATHKSKTPAKAKK